MSTLHPHTSVEPESQMDDSNQSAHESDERLQHPFEELDEQDIQDTNRPNDVSLNKQIDQDNQNDYGFQFPEDNLRNTQNAALLHTIVDEHGEPLPLSIQEAVLDLSHLAAAVVTSPTARNDSKTRDSTITSSARKRRIIDSQEDD